MLETTATKSWCDEWRPDSAPPDNSGCRRCFPGLTAYPATGSAVRAEMKRIKPDVPVLLLPGAGGQTPLLLLFPDANLQSPAIESDLRDNVVGVLLSMKYEIRAMLRQGKESTVNISSAYGKVGGPTASVYVGSKHAVEGITKSAAPELAGTGVRVNIVGPSPVETRMFNHFAQTDENKANFLDSQIPNKRIGTPEEIANAIMFIGSDKASYIIGASLAVDGGMIAD
jgi:NAD(P)-dependent dehydrogenase (short-subunit alcohol dehydrogenase family)